MSTKPGELHYREVRLPDGSNNRKSLGTTDLGHAEALAEELCREVARARLTDVSPGAVTFGQLRRAYLQRRGPQLSQKRRQFMETALGYFSEHVGDDFPVDDFGQTQADGYLAARRSGKVSADTWRAADTPRDGTLRNELQALSTVCNWAVGFKVRGRRLLTHNPVRDVIMPKEKNPRRPLMTEDRYYQLLAVADKADPGGRLRVLFVLAWETGRRINAILHLRASDLLLTSDQVRRALAEEGQDEALADHWPQAIRWRAEFDKVGHLDFSPITGAARNALEGYLRRRPKVGEAWVFPANEDPAEPLPLNMAYYYLQQAEKLAKLPPQTQGGMAPLP